MYYPRSRNQTFKYNLPISCNVKLRSLLGSTSVPGATDASSFKAYESRFLRNLLPIYQTERRHIQENCNLEHLLPREPQASFF